MARTTAHRRWMGRIGLVVGGLVVGIVLAELAARLIQPHRAADILFNAPDNAPLDLYCTDSELISRPKPGFDGTQTSLGYSVHLRINSLSLRGPEPGPKDRPRWLAAGDSFTFAAQVPEDQTFASRLSASTGIEFWNAGADGYGTWQAITRYRSLDPKLDLDGVLLVFFLGNDLADNTLFQSMQQGARAQATGDCAPLLRHKLPAWQALLQRHSYLYGKWRIRQRLAAMRSDDSHERQRWRHELAPFTTAGSGDLDRLMPGTRRALSELKRTVDNNGDSLLVAIAPPAFQIETERLQATFDLVGLVPDPVAVDAPGLAVLNELRHLGIESCDLVAPLRAAQADGERLYFAYDGHWTADGHAVVADALAACTR